MKTKIIEFYLLNQPKWQVFQWHPCNQVGIITLLKLKDNSLMAYL
jgi:hypothetical protein